jgi:hypothetical protein
MGLTFPEEASMKFKTGERVEITRTCHDNRYIGLKGTIKLIMPYGMLVRFNDGLKVFFDILSIKRVTQKK